MIDAMNSITLYNPGKLVFGKGSISDFVNDIVRLGYKKLFVITANPIRQFINKHLNKIQQKGINVHIYDKIESEPTFSKFNDILAEAVNSGCDSVVGIGGGSVLDVAKLIAAKINNEQEISEIIGIGKLKNREVYLACLPTTSGTGSEVSPNAILLDEKDNLKKGIISPHLVPDAAYIDPLLTLSVPPNVTSATGLDALTHCIEAYTNKFAHPFVDVYALKGIELIAANIERAFNIGGDISAREGMSLGSLFGGLCLGPVNTAAVHALSYPLGGEFHIAHGLSNALLLPYVMKFNIDSNPKRYADVALALGAPKGRDTLETAYNGVDKIFELCKNLKIPVKLSEISIPYEALDRMAEGAMSVQRLLVNNPKELKLEDAKNIFMEAY
jgi:alcohol dehydrogenase